MCYLQLVFWRLDLSKYHFHAYLEGESAGASPVDLKPVDSVLLAYIEEMFFSKPYNEQYNWLENTADNYQKFSAYWFNWKDFGCGFDVIWASAIWVISALRECFEVRIHQG